METPNNGPVIQPALPAISPAVIAKRLVGWSLRALLRRRKMFGLGCVASIGLAVVVSQFMAKKSWESGGTLLYTPLTTAESTASMYVPPDLKTLAALAEEPSILEALAEEFKLDIPVKALIASVEVVTPNGTKTIEFKLKWENRETCAAMVNRLMEMFRNAVLDIRLRKIQDYAKGCERNYQQASERYESSLKTMQDFNRTADSVDIGREISLLNEGLIEMYSEVGRVKRSEVNYQRQAKELDKIISDMRNKEKAEGEASKQFEAADETIADNRRRQDRLREMVTDERARVETEALLVAKRLEHKRLSKLASSSYASREELERVDAEIAVLTSKITDNEKIQSWKKELDRIDQIVVPKGKSKSQGSPIVQQTLTKRLEMDLAILGNREALQSLEGEITERKQRIDKLLGLQLKFQSLSKDVEAAEQEKLAAAAGLREMRKLQAMRVPDLVVVTPATPALDPTSNRKLWLLGILGGGLMLTTAGVLGLERAWSPGQSSETIATGLGLTLLEGFEANLLASTASNFVDPSESLPLRRLALRLRQAIRLPCGVCLLSTMNLQTGSSWLVVPLAKCLARRDERILIIDTAGLGHDTTQLEALLDATDKPVMAGLADYLSFEAPHLEDVIFATSLPAIDCILRGSTEIGVDLLATYRMSEMLVELRERYSMILMIGPRADTHVDLEILAARADAILLIANDEGDCCLRSIPTIPLLRSLGAPILGAVVVHASEPVVAKTERKSLVYRGRLDKCQS